MSKIQSQGLRIKNIGKAKGIKMIAIAKHIGYTKSGFSRKINTKQPFDDFTSEKIAEFLGIKTEFLNDVYRPFNVGDEIPEEMIVRNAPTPPETPTYPQSEETIAALARSNEALANALADKDTMQRMMKDLAEEMAKIKREIAQMQDRR